MGLPFHILDVFTTTEQMTGNQLLVVEDCNDSLSAAEMQCTAKEIGFAESAFVRRDGKVRIFTVDEEVPQAGHPVLGLAEVIGSGGVSEVTLGTQKGPISVRRGPENRWIMSQDPAEWAGEVLGSEIAKLLDSSTGAVQPEQSCPIGSTCGLKYALVAVTSEEALDSIQLQEKASKPGDWNLYFYHRTSPSALRARMFCFEAGRWEEDTATGSAAGPLAAHLAPIQATVTQGSLRRAELHITATGPASRVDVGGTVRRVAAGHWSTKADSGVALRNEQAERVDELAAELALLKKEKAQLEELCAMKDRGLKRFMQDCCDREKGLTQGDGASLDLPVMELCQSPVTSPVKPKAPQPLPVSPPQTSTVAVLESDADARKSDPGMRPANNEDWSKLTLSELRGMCRGRGINPGGGKPALTERLQGAIAAGECEPYMVSEAIAAGDLRGSTNNFSRPDGQNTGNFLTGRNSSRVLAAPGGASSISFG